MKTIDSPTLLGLALTGTRLIALGAMWACAATAALAEDKTMSVTETVDLAASPSATWSKVQDFRSWQSWHPAFAGTQIVKGTGNAKGTVRVLSTGDGAKFTEELLSHDDGARAVQYRILESPLPIEDYVSKLEVSSAGKGSHVVWSSTFKVNDGTSEEEIKKVISGVYRAGLDHLGVVAR